jgi:hypothetical protein
MTNNVKTSNDSTKPVGCGLLILTILGSVWIIALSGIDLFFNWVIEQSMFEASFVIADFRWINHAICSGLILLTCVLFAVLIKQPRIKMVFRLWAFAAVLAILAIPIKTLFLTAQNETAIFQMGAMILLLAGNLVFQKKQRATGTNPELKRVPLPGLVIFLGALMCLPWVLWGALGSILDTVLEVMVGILFAWLAVQFIFTDYLEKTQTPDREVKIKDLLLDGFVVAVFLLIMVNHHTVDDREER